MPAMENFQKPPFLPPSKVKFEQARRDQHLFAAGAALFSAQARKLHLRDALDPADVITPLLLRSAVSPATAVEPSWAADLVGAAVWHGIIGLRSRCAAAAVISAGTRVSLEGIGSISLPARILTAADAGGWLTEAGAIPVLALNVGAGLTLTPNSLGVITTMTRELANASFADEIMRQMIGDATALMLDATMFSSDDATSVKPRGLLYGVSTLTPATGGGAGAALADVGVLVDKLAENGGGTAPVLVCSPGGAATLKGLVGPGFDIPILGSSAVSAKTIIAIETGSFVSAFDPVPEFRASSEATIHEDTAALAIATSSPLSHAAPVRNLFQTDTVSLRMILRASFGMRASGHVQFISSVTW